MSARAIYAHKRFMFLAQIKTFYKPYNNCVYF